MSTNKFPKSVLCLSPGSAEAPGADKITIFGTPTGPSDPEIILSFLVDLTETIDDDPSVAVLPDPVEPSEEESPTRACSSLTKATPKNLKRSPPETVTGERSCKKRIVVSDVFDRSVPRDEESSSKSETGDKPPRPVVSDTGNENDGQLQVTSVLNFPGVSVDEASLTKIEAVGSIDGYFMPFVGQANPLLSIPLAQEDNKHFAKRVSNNPFRPRSPPDSMWIAFNQELYDYLAEYLFKANAISTSQFLNLLKAYLRGIPNYNALRPIEILKKYQLFNYRFNQAVRDYHEFTKDTNNYFVYSSLKRSLETQMCNDPVSKLTLDLYNYPRALRSQVFEQFRSFFNLALFPRNITEEMYEEIKVFMTLLNKPFSNVSLEAIINGRSSHLTPNLGGTKSNDRDYDPKSPPRKANPFFIGRREWVRVRGAKPRRHQAFVDPDAYKDGPIITTDEVNYRKENHLCSKCGNHKQGEGNSCINHPAIPKYFPSHNKILDFATVPQTLVCDELSQTYADPFTQLPRVRTTATDLVDLPNEYATLWKLHDEELAPPICFAVPAKVQTGRGYWTDHQISVGSYCRKTIITDKLVQELHLRVFKAPNPVSIMPKYWSTATTCDTVAIANIMINDVQTAVLGLVMITDEAEIILGMDWLTQHRVTLGYDKIMGDPFIKFPISKGSTET